METLSSRQHSAAATKARRCHDQCNEIPCRWTVPLQPTDQGSSSRAVGTNELLTGITVLSGQAPYLLVQSSQCGRNSEETKIRSRIGRKNDSTGTGSSSHLPLHMQRATQNRRQPQQRRRGEPPARASHYLQWSPQPHKRCHPAHSACRAA